MVRPAGRTHSGVKVPYRPGRGNCWPDGKGTRREAESEGSLKANRWPDELKTAYEAGTPDEKSAGGS